MMEDMDEAESSTALAWWVKSSGPITFTLNVGSSTSSWLPELDVCVVMTLRCLSLDEGNPDLFNFLSWLWSLYSHK